MSFYKPNKGGNSKSKDSKNNNKTEDSNKLKMLRGGEIYEAVLKEAKRHDKNQELIVLTFAVEGYYDLREYIKLDEKGFSKVERLMFNAFGYQMQESETYEEFIGQIEGYLGVLFQMATYTAQNVYSKDGVMNVSNQAKFNYAAQENGEIKPSEYVYRLNEAKLEEIKNFDGEVKNWIQDDEKIQEVLNERSGAEPVEEYQEPTGSIEEDDDDLPF